jgi:hypothetical protein
MNSRQDRPVIFSAFRKCVCCKTLSKALQKKLLKKRDVTANLEKTENSDVKAIT